MRILRLYTKLPPLKGGMEQHIKNLTIEQHKLGHNVKIIFNVGEKVSIHDVQILRWLPLYRAKPQAIGFLIFYIFIILKLMIKRENYDVVHIHGDWSSLIFSKILKRLTSAKVSAFSLHGQVKDKITYTKLLPHLLKNADIVFSTGYQTAKELQNVSSSRIIHQPSGIDEIFFEEYPKQFTNEQFQVVTVANLFPKKNLGFILEIAEEASDIYFLIIGEGPEKFKLIETKKRNSIYNVTFLGFRTKQEIHEYLKQTDCFLLTSFEEGTPTSILEAMACGLPIITSNAGGIENIIKDYENGFVLDTFNVKSYIEKIDLLKNDINLRKTMYENNKRLAQRFRWEIIANEITNRMIECMNNKSPQFSQ